MSVQMAQSRKYCVIGRLDYFFAEASNYILFDFHDILDTVRIHITFSKVSGCKTFSFIGLTEINDIGKNRKSAVR